MVRPLPVAAALAALAVLPAAAHAAYPGGNGRIALVSSLAANCTSNHTQNDILSVLPSGQQAWRLTDHPANDIQPEYSPDGRKIAFATNRDFPGKVGVYNQPPELYLMDADGANPQRLTFRRRSYETEPTWSPDATRLAFFSARRDDGQPDGIYAMNLDGTGEQLLAAGGSEPAWSPKGDKVAFMRRDGPTTHDPWRIWTMNADGTGQTSLGLGTDPDWSPDAKRLAFVRDRAIKTMAADGSDVQTLTATPASAQDYDAHPVWSPNGQLLAFARIRYDAQGRFDIATYKMRTTGANQTRITGGAGQACDGFPLSWQPLV